MSVCLARGRPRVVIARSEATKQSSLSRRARVLAETRQRGYATRDAGFFGGRIGEPQRDDGLSAIAVPVRHGPRVYGALNLLWLRAAFTVEDFAARHLADLQAAAADIAAAVRNAEQRRPRPN